MTPPLAPRDGAYLRRALLLAARGRGQTAPNPLVGAVVVRGDRVIAEGWHAVFGGPHAEAVALTAAGDAAHGATLYVSLEPCNHVGKTPPCTDAIIAAGIARVVIGHGDPNPAVAGGVARLRDAGIEVAFADGGLLERAAELNAPFLFTHAVRDRPFITLKLALSLDAAIAPADRRQLWLTGDAARRYVHRLRADADAVAVGIGTALMDDPALTVRSGRRPRVAPARVVFDRTARLPIGSKLARTAKRLRTWVVAERPEPTQAAVLAKAGVQLYVAEGLPAQLAALRGAGVGSLLVEGGAGLAGALLSGGLVDRLIIFQAPVLLGAGALAGFGTVVPPDGGMGRWQVVERRSLGDDQMTRYRPIR